MMPNQKLAEALAPTIRICKAPNSRTTLWYLSVEKLDGKESVRDAKGNVIGYRSKKIAGKAAVAYGKQEFDSNCMIAMPSYD